MGACESSESGSNSNNIGDLLDSMLDPNKVTSETRITDLETKVTNKLIRKSSINNNDSINVQNLVITYSDSYEDKINDPCFRKSINYMKIYEILNKKEKKNLTNSEIQLKQFRRKKILFSELKKNNLNGKKKNLLNTFSLIENNNIDLTYEDFSHTLHKYDNNLSNKIDTKSNKIDTKSNESNESNKSTESTESNKSTESLELNSDNTVQVNDTLVISIDEKIE